MYASKASFGSPVGASNDSLPFGPKYSFRGDTPVFGGHESYVRHAFAPASKTVASASLSVPLSLSQ